jgi:SAM-dependent methyltransferase
MTQDIASFYTDLHPSMHRLAKVEDAPFPTSSEVKAILSQIAGVGQNGLPCLDVGCGGTAVNTYTLHDLAPGRVYAADLNRHSLLMARQRFEALRGPTVQWTQCSLLNLPFPPSRFGLVVCSGVLHHTPDPPVALAEIARILAQDGWLYISVYCFEGSMMEWAVRAWRPAAHVVPFGPAHTLFGRIKTINNFVLDHMYVPILWLYSEKDFCTLLERHSFSVLQSTRSQMDPCTDGSLLGKAFSGDGLLRVFLCRKEVE